MAANVQPLDLRRTGGNILLVGHRAGGRVAPENSLDAIAAAAAAGIEAVELDVARRADGALALSHEESAAPGAASLDDGLALAARLGLAVQLDVKVAGLEGGILAAVERHGLLTRSFVSSPSAATLRAFVAVAPSLPRAFTYPDDRLRISGRVLLRPALRPLLALLRARAPRRLPALLRAVDANAATLNWAVVTRAAVDACHDAGAAVYVWTVNDPALARTLIETGIDGIISDIPQVLAGGIAGS